MWFEAVVFKVGSSSCCISITQELVRNVDSWASPPTHTESEVLQVGPAICVFTSPSGDSDIH